MPPGVGAVCVAVAGRVLFVATGAGAALGLEGVCAPAGIAQAQSIASPQRINRGWAFATGPTIFITSKSSSEGKLGGPQAWFKSCNSPSKEGGIKAGDEVNAGDR